MNAAAYRRLRILVGGLVLGICTLAFADIGNWISAPLARAALWLQFAPSLSSLAGGFAWLSAGCIVVLLLTLVFGRIYCAMLCPLGVLMDLSAWLAGRGGKKRKLPYRPGRMTPRLLAVAVVAAGCIAGTAVPLGFLDPYSLFGKIISATLRPALARANHLLASTGIIQPVDVSPVAWTSAGIALGLLGIVAIAAIFRGRLWCNTVCPVGAVLGFFSRHAWFRLRIADASCVGCSMCERVCPAQCIDFRNHRIDHSRCIMCLACVTSCKRSGISLVHDHGKAPELPAVPGPPSTLRRLVLAAGLILPASLLAREHRRRREHQLTADEPNCEGECADDCRSCGNGLNQFNKRPVLPPGAGSLERFQSLCTGCQLCVANCPDQVLRPSIFQHGLAGFLQPYQDFEVSFCSYNCSNCSQICPTGAIRPITVEERKTVRTGKAEFFRGRCVVKTDGTSCGACSEHCPTQAVHMVPWKNGLTIPEVDEDLCIGCGGCEFICPVRPNKAIVVTGLKVHERAKAVLPGKDNTVRKTEEEFPF